jgi:hypothetical protein
VDQKLRREPTEFFFAFWPFNGNKITFRPWKILISFLNP